MEAGGLATWSGYSMEERDRRWRAVRGNAAAAGLDCILVPLTLDDNAYHPRPDEPSATGADGRYLTQIDGAVVILPTDDAVEPIVITERNARNSWFSETRTSGRGWIEPMVRALQESGMEHAIIGVVGLQSGRFTHPSAADGVVVHSAYADLTDRLPEATFRDATDVVGQARYVKSEEEIASLRQAATIAAAALKTLAQEARPGVAEAALYARVMHRLLAAGSEYVPLTLAAGPADRLRYRHVNPRVGRTLESGWVIEAEVRAVWGGLTACESQTIVLGPIPDAYRPLVELHQEVFAAGLAALRPGREIREVVAEMQQAGARDGLETEIVLHGCGYGDDGPRPTPNSSAATPNGVRVEQNTTWTLAPVVSAADNAAIRFVWGSTLLVTEGGGVPLAERTPAILSI
jgi:Xaa-Pro aminopeptidase